MSSARRFVDVTSWIYLAATLLYLWRPALFPLSVGSAALFMVAMLYAARHATPADRARRRETAWLIPVAMVALAAQLVYSAAPQERLRTGVLAAGLVGAGVALFVLRRRTA